MTIRKNSRKHFLFSMWAVFCILLLSCQQVAKYPQGIKHVIVIGLDGLSVQGLREANTPCLDSLMQNGAYSYTVRCVLPTVSKPNWNAMLCGAGPDITGVNGNNWNRNNYEIPPVAMTENNSFPNIFRIIRDQKTGAELGSIYQWKDFGSILDDKIMNKSESYPTELETTQKIAAYILEKKPDFLFTQLDDIDHFGHSNGHMSPEYIRGIETTDANVRAVVEAIRQAGIAESTLIMVVSDHGGVFRGHGGNTYEELTTPIIFAGKGVKKNYPIKQQIYRYDVAASIAFALGIEAPQVWIGRPVCAAFEGFNEPANLWQGVEILPPPMFNTETYKAPFGITSVGKPAEVIIKVPLGVEGEIRYTTDGSVPTRESMLYNDVFTVTDTLTVITAKLFNDKGESHKVSAQYRVVEK